jgi:PadR family transcriptional regulator
MRGEILKGHLELLVLSALRSQAAHGYAIIKTIRERSAGEIDLLEGSLYPALHRLEERGNVSSRWSTTQGRKRRVYELTRKGGRALAEHEREWDRFSATMKLVLGKA